MFGYWWFAFGFVAVAVVFWIWWVIEWNTKNTYAYEGEFEVTAVLLSIFSFISLCLVIFSWLAPLDALHQYSQNLNFYEIYQSQGDIAFKEIQDLDVASYNSWLLYAKRDKETLGNFSVYFNVPVEEMQYIKHNKSDKV